MFLIKMQSIFINSLNYFRNISTEFLFPFNLLNFYLRLKGGLSFASYVT